MIDGNNDIQRAHAREQLKAHQEYEISLDAGLEEALEYSDSLKKLIALAGEFERLRCHLQTQTKTFDSIMDGLTAWDLSGDPESEFQALVKKYAESYADV